MLNSFRTLIQTRKLRSADSGIRAKAVTTLGMIGGPVAVKAIVTMLDDLNPTVRKMAVWAIGRNNVTEAVGRLVDLLDDRNRSGEDIYYSVRIEAIRVLGVLGDESATASLADHFDREPSKELALALRQLGWNPPTGCLSVSLAVFLEDGGMLRRITGAEVARAVVGMHAFGDMWAWIISQVPQLDSSFDDELLTMLRAPADNRCHCTIIHLIRIRRDVRAATQLISIGRHEDPDVRGAAATALGIIVVPEAGALLRTLLRDSDCRVVSSAASSLASYACPATIAALDSALSRGPASSNQYAFTYSDFLDSLASCGAEARPQLHKWLKAGRLDGVGDLVVSAARAIQSASHPESFDALLDALVMDKMDAYGRSSGHNAIVDSLIAIGESGVDRLVEKLSHKSPNVVTGVIYALAKIGGGRAIGALMELFNDLTNDGPSASKQSIVVDTVEALLGVREKRILPFAIRHGYFTSPRYIQEAELRAFILHEWQLIIEPLTECIRDTNSEHTANTCIGLLSEILATHSGHMDESELRVIACLEDSVYTRYEHVGSENSWGDGLHPIGEGKSAADS